jgi:hypothetical protein
MMENAYIHCLDLTSVWRRWRRRRPACIVERRWRRRKRPTCAVDQQRRRRRRSACTRGRVVAAIEETGLSSIDDARQRRERWGLRDFCDEKRNVTGRTTIYRFETISSSSGIKPLLLLLSIIWTKIHTYHYYVQNQGSLR